MRSRYSGKLQPSKRELLWLREGKACYWCRRPTLYTKKNRWDKATKDHIVPRYKGGGSDESNLVSACALCNNRRAYEDALGLLDGSLLGNYPPTKEQRELHRIARKNKKNTGEKPMIDNCNLDTATQRFIAEFAESLNVQSGEISDIIVELNRQFAATKINVEAWVPADKESEIEIGYAQNYKNGQKGEWQLLTGRRWRNTPLVEASRELQIQALKSIPALVKAFESEAEELEVEAATIRKRAREIEEVAMEGWIRINDHCWRTRTLSCDPEVQHQQAQYDARD